MDHMDQSIMLQNGNVGVTGILAEPIFRNDGSSIEGSKQIAMAEWIAGALRSIDENNDSTKAISSSAYLSCALKIAHSLAGQLCDAEKECEAGENRTTIATNSWHRLVTVYVNDANKTYSTDDHLQDELALDEALGNLLDNHKSEGREYLQSEVLNETDGIGEGIWSQNSDEKKDTGLQFNEDLFDDGGLFESSASLERSSLSGRGKPRSASPDLEELKGMMNAVIPDPSVFLEGDNANGFDQKKDEGNDDSSQDLVAGILGGVLKENKGIHYFFQSMDETGEPAKNRGNTEVSSSDYLNVSSAKLAMQNDTEKERDIKMHIFILGLVFIELFSGGMEQTQELIQQQLMGHSYNNNLHGPNLRKVNLESADNIIDALGDDDELFGDIGESNNSSGHGSGHEPFCPKKRRSRSVEMMFSSSLEHLKSMGLPNSLCDLIANMVDCLKGEFSKDEAYSSMVDVKEDLKLMMDCPEIYLSDIKLDHASATQLQLDDIGAKLLGRDAEIASLIEVYRRSVSNECEAAIIMGAGGIGKSKLGHELVRYAKSGGAGWQGGCITLSGKFDKLQASQPFSAVALAFSDYFDWLSREDNTMLAGKVSATIKAGLGREVQTVAKLIPSLTKIMGDSVDPIDDIDFSDAQKRLKYLLCELIRMICHSHETPLILWLDDLQWADAASIALISLVLLEIQRNRDNAPFFFLGCCRDDEMESDHALWKMLLSVQDFGIGVTKIPLDCLDKESVNSIISQKLKLLPRLTRPLADIVQSKSGGNPFFVGQLMVELSKEALLRPSLIEQRWVWDEEKIQERALPKDVIEFITASLHRLPEDILSALRVLSCFGASAEYSLVEKLEKEMDLSLSVKLDAASAEGFLLKKNKQYFFVHDRVQEAVYISMKPHERCLFHFDYGMALCDVATRDEDNNLYLIAVGQINLGGPEAVSKKDQRVKVARFNLRAGQIAIVTDFLSAYWFFDHGISFLSNSSHWESDYELCLELYNKAAECALGKGEDHEKLEILIEQVLHYARCFEEKLNVLFIRMSLFLYQSKLKPALQLGFDVLLKLGVISIGYKEITPNVIASHWEITKRMLSEITVDELLHYKIMHDPVKEFATLFLSKLSGMMYFLQSSEQPFVVLRMVQMTLEHGTSPASPLGFALYASFIASMGDFQEGYRYSKFSKVLLEKIGSPSFKGEVFAYTTQLIAHIEPIQSVTKHHLDGQKAAMQVGNTGFAMCNYMLYAHTIYCAGEKLSKTKFCIEDCIRLMRKQKHVLYIGLMLPLGRTVSTLHGNSGPDNVPTKLEDELRANSPMHSRPYYFNKIFIAFIFRMYDETKEFTIKFSNFNVGLGSAYVHNTMHKFYSGLVAYWIGREEGDTKWLRKGNEAKRTIKKFADNSKWNFENKLYLLNAESKFCERDFESAEQLYDAAISSAKKHKFLNEEAISLELAAIFYLETGRRKKSITYFSRAIEKYREWEAHAKALSLVTYVEELVSRGS